MSKDIADYSRTTAPLADPQLFPSEWAVYGSAYFSLLKRSNGLVVNDTVRVFGVGPTSLTREVVEWNSASWRRGFPVPTEVLFWGESVFGDQYGMDPKNGTLLVLWCEDGLLEPFLTESEVFGDQIVEISRRLVDVALANEARDTGLRVSLTEHLGFSLPLVLGGEYDLVNLEVIEGSAHLELLAQIHAQVAGFPEGTKVQGFVEK